MTQDETWGYDFEPEAKKAEYAMEAPWLSSLKQYENLFSRDGDVVYILE